MRTLLAVLAVALLALAATAPARTADPATHTIAPSLADPGTTDTTPTRGDNLVWLAAPQRRVGKLLVFLPLGGMLNIPTEFEEFGSEAGRLGYHTIVLAYRNEAPVAMAPPVGCGNGVEASTAPPNCAIDARMEILNGREKSATVNVNRAGSIENRLNKVLVHLAATYPSEDWGQFIDTSGAEPAPKWSQTVIAGGSFGAGQAAIIAAEHEVHRAVLITGWTDAKHGGVTLGATPANRYATLIHAREEFFARTCFAYVALAWRPPARWPRSPSCRSPRRTRRWSRTARCHSARANSCSTSTRSINRRSPTPTTRARSATAIWPGRPTAGPRRSW